MSIERNFPAEKDFPPEFFCAALTQMTLAGLEKVPDAAWEVTAHQWAKSHVPGLGRMATPEEIAAFALVLASNDHPYMTGAQMVIDGGKTADAG
jgi:hypothetical protein